MNIRYEQKEDRTTTFEMLEVGQVFKLYRQIIETPPCMKTMDFKAEGDAKVNAVNLESGRITYVSGNVMVVPLEHELIVGE